MMKGWGATSCNKQTAIRDQAPVTKGVCVTGRPPPMRFRKKRNATIARRQERNAKTPKPSSITLTPPSPADASELTHLNRFFDKANAAARANAVTALQHRHGNRFVQRFLVQRDDTKAPPATIDLKISWSGMYHDDKVNAHDIKADVVVKSKKGGATLASGNGDGSVTLSVTRGKSYYVVITPTAAKPDDRYSTTSKAWSAKTVPTDADLAIKASLTPNRWNLRNVDYVWRAKGIDATKANQIEKTTLFGHDIRVNKLALDKVKKANELFAKESAEIQKEITNSILVIGGYAKRTTSEGTFSNHSLGTAIDMNYNLGTKQNYHFKKKVKADEALLGLVQMVVRRASGKGSFDIWKATGQAQLEASTIFNQEFPTYLREQMAALLPKPAAAPTPSSGSWLGDLAQSALDAVIKALNHKSVFSQYSPADIEKAIAAANKAGKKDVEAQLRVVHNNYNELKAWLEGAPIEGGTTKQEGMIPLHKDLLKIMLAAGWDWGGDWSSAKDYMHFEDLAATSAISTAPVPSGHK